jgi:RNA-directed DNA polymerase
MFIHKYKDITSIENILITWEYFLRGKRHKKDVIKFGIQLGKNLLEIFYLLKEKKYKHADYSVFNISDPKPRIIHKAVVRDRVLHHLIYKELYPYFDKKFIFDSYSCQKKKGVHKAIRKFKIFSDKVSKNNTKTCYILKCDIKKFFANIDHHILKKILEKYIKDKDIFNLLIEIIDSFSSVSYIRDSVNVLSRENEKGLPLGNLTSQLLANIYMNEFDQFLKQKLKVKYYIRYADDFVVFSQNKKYLEFVLKRMKEFLEDNLKLFMHSNKVFIKTLASGVDFLGWVHFPRHRVLRTRTKNKVLRKINKYSKTETINSYRGFLSHGNTYKIRKKINLKLNPEVNLI